MPNLIAPTARKAGPLLPFSGAFEVKSPYENT